MTTEPANLQKLQAIATAAMHGIISSQSPDKNPPSADEVARQAVEYANALIKALDDEKQKCQDRAPECKNLRSAIQKSAKPAKPRKNMSDFENLEDDDPRPPRREYRTERRIKIDGNPFASAFGRTFGSCLAFAIVFLMLAAVVGGFLFYMDHRDTQRRHELREKREVEEKREREKRNAEDRKQKDLDADRELWDKYRGKD